MSKSVFYLKITINLNRSASDIIDCRCLFNLKRKNPKKRRAWGHTPLRTPFFRVFFPGCRRKKNTYTVKDFS
jgi:hypothetical protein